MYVWILSVVCAIDLFKIGCVWKKTGPSVGFIRVAAVTKMWRCVTPRLVLDATPWAVSTSRRRLLRIAAIVFFTHILPRINEPAQACACGVPNVIPHIMANLVLPQVSGTFRRLIPGYKETHEAHVEEFEKREGE